jgi:hypothetical protein
MYCKMDFKLVDIFGLRNGDAMQVCKPRQNSIESKWSRVRIPRYLDSSTRLSVLALCNYIFFKIPSLLAVRRFAAQAGGPSDASMVGRHTFNGLHSRKWQYPASCYVQHSNITICLHIALRYAAHRKSRVCAMCNVHGKPNLGARKIELAPVSSDMIGAAFCFETDKWFGNWSAPVIWVRALYI